MSNRKVSARTAARRQGRNLLCIVILLIVLFPFLWILVSSFKGIAEVQKVPIEYIPKNPTLETYKSVLFDYRNGSWISYLLNSLKIAVITTLIVTFLSALSGYAFSRIHFKGADALLILLLVTQMFPGPSILIPLYGMMDRLKLVDTHFALILINMAFTLPFAVWMSMGCYENIPNDMEEAAYIDGCSVLKAYWLIVFPVSKIGLVAVALYTFIITWAEYIFTLVILESKEKATVSLKLGAMVSEITVHWNEISAATIIVSLPLLVFFLWAQRYYVSGVIAGAVKE